MGLADAAGYDKCWQEAGLLADAAGWEGRWCALLTLRVMVVKEPELTLGG